MATKEIEALAPEKTIQEKMADLKKLARSLNAKWDKDHKAPSGSRPRIQLGTDIEDRPIVSTGNPSLDRALGGGIPTGTWIDIWGRAGSSKSTTAALLSRQVQDKGKIVIWYQTETSEPSDALHLCGVNPELFFFIDARGFGEDGFERIQDLLLDGMTARPEIGLIVIDSITALLPSKELNSVSANGLEQASIANLAALMSRMGRIVSGRGWLSQGAILCSINQERAQISATPMPNAKTGGLAMQFYPKIAVHYNVGTKGQIKDTTGSVIGDEVFFKVTKNNLGSRPFVTGSFKFHYGIGLDLIQPYVDEALDNGIIVTTSPGHFLVRALDFSETKVHGGEKLSLYFKENGDNLADLKSQVDSVRDLLRKEGADYQMVNGQWAQVETGEVVDLLALTASPGKEKEAARSAETLALVKLGLEQANAENLMEALDLSQDCDDAVELQ